MVDQPGDGVYPEYWEADVVLRDGGTAHLRPIQPADADAVQAFHTGQSQNSIYMRFFAFKARLSGKELKRFTEVDYNDRVAFVITIGGEIIGIGRYDRLDDPDRGRGRLQHRRRPPGPRHRLHPAGAPRRRRPGKRHPHVQRRSAAGEPEDADGLLPTPATTSNGISTTASSAWNSTSTPRKNPGP